MTQPVSITLTVNSLPATIDVNPTDRLSKVLRDNLNFTDTKVGCDAGDCGACTVLINGEAACACLVAAAQVNGATIETAASLSDDDTLNQLQRSFLHHGAAQCGICTPGMLMSAKVLLDANPTPTKPEVEDALGGVLCRCTGYRKIIDAVVNANQFEETITDHEAGQSVGTAVRHVDGLNKVDGTLKFGADEFPADCLFIKVIRSPHHHANFSLNGLHEFVESHDGLELILSAKDVPGRNYFGVIPQFADQPVFAEQTARFRGEAVAAIVGSASALEKLTDDALPIQWEVLPHSLLPAEATKKSSPLVHKDRADNLLVKGYVACGDAAAALEQATYRASTSITTPFIEHAYIEPEAGYCIRKADRLELHGCTQAAQMDRESMAEIMNLPIESIRIMPSACGGGFGSKLDLSFQPYIAIAAWILNKPVGLNYTRGDSMRSTTKRHSSEITLTAGCDENGKLCGFEFYGMFNTGAYASWGPTVANRVPVHASGPYFTPDYHAKSVAIHTNAPPAGAFRGFGVPQSAVAQETIFDQLADLAGIDRLEFRLRNALRNKQATVTGQTFDTGVGIVECLQALQPAWNKANKEAHSFNISNNLGPLRKGVGIGTCWYGCGNTSLPNPSTIRMGITPDGTLVLHQGAMDIGQGSNTVITQVAADALGVPVQHIKLVGCDTDLTPDAGKTSASRQTYVTGMAAKLSAEALRADLLRMANVASDAQLDFSGTIIELKDQSQTATIDLTRIKPNEFGYAVMSEETYDPPTEPLDEQGQGKPYAQYGYGAQLMELTVDTALGTVKLDHITAAHDVGRAINPLLVEAQIEGGIAQGIGLAMMEEYLPGRTENLHDYLIPTIGDMPEFDNIIVEVADMQGPYGAKGLGEHVLIPTAPAILNAIRDATGACVTDLPCTPDKVLSAISGERRNT